MSQAQEARERRFEKALKTIAEVTEFHARTDARAECRDDPSRDFDEEYELILENYKGDALQMLEDSYS